MVRHLSDEPVKSGKILRPAGCHHCNQTGFGGRVGIFEMLKMDDHIADALRRADNSLFVERAKAQETYKPLLVSALEHVVNGVTTIQRQFEWLSSLSRMFLNSKSSTDDLRNRDLKWRAAGSSSLALEALS